MATTVSQYESELTTLRTNIATLQARMASDSYERYRTADGNEYQRSQWPALLDALTRRETFLLQQIRELNRSSGRGPRAVKLSRAGGIG